MSYDLFFLKVAVYPETAFGLSLLKLAIANLRREKILLPEFLVFLFPKQSEDIIFY
jgi:hypothetical protein